MAEFKNGIGLDIGTGFICSSRMKEDGTMVTKSIRDSFLEICPANKLISSTMRKGLTKSNINFFEVDDKFYVLGEDSLIQSIERQVVVQRPMRKGVISPIEIKALPMFKALLKELLGTPQVENEKVVFTLPGAPVDAGFDVMYHENVIEHILKDLGFAGRSLNEGHALVFSELSEDDFSGITMSWGSGMTNVAGANFADLVMKFSVAKGGDYIDESTALALGFDPKNPKLSEITPNLVTYVKEQGVNILKPDTADRIKVGISAHYKALIRYVVDLLVRELKNNKSEIKFTKPVPIVIAGGTSLATGFLELFKLELDKHIDELPFQIKEIRMSKETLISVSQGCLLALLSEDN
jgi:hypothetical protein